MVFLNLYLFIYLFFYLCDWGSEVPSVLILINPDTCRGPDLVTFITIIFTIYIIYLLT